MINFKSFKKNKPTNDLEIEVFEKKPIEEIINSFKETGLYEDEFIEALKEGLEKSSIYSTK